MTARPLSPTGYKLHASCPRAWWYHYVLGLPSPSTAATATGTAVHAAVEAYLGGSAWPEPSEATPAEALERARAGQAILDAWIAPLAAAPRTYRIEASADLDLVPHGGLGRMGGRVDWSGLLPDGTPWVLDHKTTANPRYWLTPEQCAVDPQLTAYAAALFPHAARVVVGHVYLPKPPTEPCLVTGVAERAGLEATIRAFAATSVAVDALRSAPDADCVEAKTAACYAYGGCPYADRCSAAPASLRERTRVKHQETNVDEIPTAPPLTDAQARLRARLAGGAATTKPTPVAAPQTPTQATETTSAPSVAPAAALPPDAPRRRKAPAAPPPDAIPTAPLAPGVDAVLLLDLPAASASSGLSLSARPLVLVGCFAHVPTETLEGWAPDAFEAGRLDADGKDHGHYLLVPFFAGPRHVAATLCTDLASGARTLPVVLTIPESHPLAPFLVPALSAYGLVVRGGGR